MCHSRQTLKKHAHPLLSTAVCSTGRGNQVPEKCPGYPSQDHLQLGLQQQPTNSYCVMQLRMCVSCHSAETNSDYPTGRSAASHLSNFLIWKIYSSFKKKKVKRKKKLWKQIVYIAESSLFILPISLLPDNWLLLLFLFTVCSDEF